MICVSIARGRHRHVLAEHKFLAQNGVELVEIRLDFLQTRMDVRRLMRDRPTPILFTIRRPSDGGRFQGSEESRQILLRSAIAEGVDYIDLEDGVAARIPRYGSTKRIVSYHNFQETPDDLEAIFERLAAQEADIVKICTLANSPDDNFRILDLVEKKREILPVVGFCMGDMGIPSRVLCQAFGSPFTFACSDKRNAVAPGQVPFDEMLSLYRVNQITRETKIYGVMADPVGHSLSPLIHNRAFVKCGLDDSVYLPLRVPKESVGSFFEKAPQKWNLRGLSVTIPHKEAVLPWLEETDTSVRVIGACNTILWQDGRCRGTNTDYQAAMDSFAEVANAEIPQRIDWVEPLDDPQTGEVKGTPLAGLTALILGAGGVGKAPATGLGRRGASLILSDVDQARSEALSAKFQEEGFSSRAVPWEERHFTQPRFVVNGTPVGMSPKVKETPFDGSFLRPSMLVFDAVYNPEKTLLIQQAEERGCATVSGLSMFVRQAGLQFRLFTGVEPPWEEMRNVVKKALQVSEW